jgi:putative transposase
MYAQLGNIRFDLITYFNGFDEAKSYNFAEHQRIENKPRLQYTGESLEELNIKLNFQVLNPFTGKPCRAVLVGFLDWKSGGLAGFEIMLEEDTQCIASALRNAILSIGRIPDIV